MSKRAPSGFTLVELLVVIAIIGVLIALLLPAVQAAREAAKRMQCSNHLKQIGLAVHNYNDVNKHFPEGYRIASTNADQYEMWGWLVIILPYMEQQNLYDQLDVENRTLHDVISVQSEWPLLQTQLSTYRCPSDKSRKLLLPEKRHFDGQAAGTNFHPSINNYMGNRGFYDRGGDIEPWGVLYGRSAVTFADISDGSSQTFLAGERDDRCASGTWIGSRNPPGPDMWGSYYHLARVSRKLNEPCPTGGCDATANICTEGFSSQHPTGANFVMCDASVHFINENIDYNNAGLDEAALTNLDAFNEVNLGVYQRLGHREDDQVINGF